MSCELSFGLVGCLHLPVHLLRHSTLQGSAQSYRAGGPRVHPEFNASNVSLNALSAKLEWYSPSAGRSSSNNSSSSSSTSGDGVPEEPVVESWFKGKRVLVVDDGKAERKEVMYFLFTFRTSYFSGPRDQKVTLKRLLGASKMSPAASREVPGCLWRSPREPLEKSPGGSGEVPGSLLRSPREALGKSP